MALANKKLINPPSNLMPVLMMGGLFFLFGFITWLNGALIPFLQLVCSLTEFEALLIAFCFYVAYVVMALPMAAVLKVTGYRYGMVIGLVLIGIGALGFVPAALNQAFWIFLLAQFVVGSGLTILQTASNPYIVKLGPEKSAAARIAFMGILNKAAGVVAPLVFTALVLGDLPDVNAMAFAEMSESEQLAHIDLMANGLVTPYLGMAIALFVLAFLFRKAPLPDIDVNESRSTQGQQGEGSILAFPQVILGAITLFMYVGVEVIAGDTIGLYGSTLGLENTTVLTSYTMGMMVLGYCLGLVLIPRWVSQQVALSVSAILGVVFSIALVFASNTSTGLSEIIWGWLGLTLLPNSVCLLALLGLANAMVWPAVWPLALKDLGAKTAQGSAILIMGIAGGAILPLLYGGLAEFIGAQQSYGLLIACYLFIFYFGVIGHKKRAW